MMSLPGRHWHIRWYGERRSFRPPEAAAKNAVKARGFLSASIAILVVMPAVSLTLFYAAQT